MFSHLPESDANAAAAASTGETPVPHQAVPHQAVPHQAGPDQAVPHIVVVPGQGRQTVLWVIAILLAVIATALVLRWDEAALSKSAWAQSAVTGAGPSPGGRGIYAFAGQISSRSYGLFMLDVDSGTIWCYEMARGTFDEPHLKLVAARSWIFDRYLEEFNVAAPTPGEVRRLVEQQQAAQRAQAQPPGGGQLAPPAPSP